MFDNIRKKNLEDSIIFSNNDLFKEDDKSDSQNIYYYTYNDNNLICNKSCQSALYTPSNLKFKKFNSFLKKTKKLNFQEKLIERINYLQKSQQKTNNKLSSLISILLNALLIKNNYSVFHFDFVLKNNYKPKITNGENVVTDNINNKDINNVFRLDYNLNKTNRQNNNSKTTISKVQRYFKSNNNKNDILNNPKKMNNIKNFKKNSFLNNNDKNDHQTNMTNSHTTNNLAEENDICNLTEEQQNSFREKERIILENVKEINTKLSAKGPVKITLKPEEKSINLNNIKNQNEKKNINSNNTNSSNMYKNSIKNINKVEIENDIRINKEIKNINKKFNEDENVIELLRFPQIEQNKYDNNKQDYPRKIRGFNFRNNINNSNNKRPNSSKPSDDAHNEDKREMNELNNINLHSSNVLKKNIMTAYDFNKKSNEFENEFEDEPNINKYFYMSNRK